jgi:hypothetical protein
MIFIITRGWHNRPGVNAVPIASQTRIKKKKIIIIVNAWDLNGMEEIPIIITPMSPE